METEENFNSDEVEEIKVLSEEERKNLRIQDIHDRIASLKAMLESDKLDQNRRDKIAEPLEQEKEKLLP